MIRQIIDNLEMLPGGIREDWLAEIERQVRMAEMGEQMAAALETQLQRNSAFIEAGKCAVYADVTKGHMGTIMRDRDELLRTLTAWKEAQ